MKILMRILDMDGARLSETDGRLHKYLRQYRIPADVELVACHLEMSRQGLMNRTPALQVNGYTVSAGRELSDALLQDCCERLSRWLKQKETV